MRIKTYFILDEKELNSDMVLNSIFESLYFTLIPAMAVWLFFETRIIWFLIMLVVPLFFRVEFRKKRIYDKDMRFRKSDS